MRQEFIKNGLFIGSSFNICYEHLNEKIYKETLKRFDTSTISIFNILNSKDPNKSLRGKKLRKIFDVRNK